MLCFLECYLSTRTYLIISLVLWVCLQSFTFPSQSVTQGNSNSNETGMFCYRRGGQHRGPAESIFLLLTVKTSTAEAPESLCETPLAPQKASSGTPTHPPTHFLHGQEPHFTSGWASYLCLICFSPALSVPELLIGFSALILDITSALPGLWVGPIVIGIPAQILWACALLVRTL